ncbi:MAG: Spy/CpxP family protein refolding chaperone [Acidobacteriota bacterium]
MFSRKALAGIAGMILAASMVAFAQQPAQTPSTAREGLRRERMERKERHRDGMRHKERRGHRGPGQYMSELNLSDAQREQIRAITQRRLEATKAQREELFKMREKRIAGTFGAEDEARARTLRDEIRVAMEGIRGETEGILTAEQKARLEQLKVERKAKHEERQTERKARREQRLKERQERLNKNPL